MLTIQLAIGAVAGCGVLTIAGCDEPALKEICPDISEGELVITELRGSQGPGNQFVEFFNASGREIELYGLKLLFRKNDGSDPSGEFSGVIIVRRDNMTSPGEYFAIGSGTQEQAVDGIGYAASPDFEKDMPDVGLVELVACDDTVIDAIVYGDLPEPGTLLLDGALQPDAGLNDIPANFCTDDRPDPDPAAGDVRPGTPGRANPTCAELEEMQP